MVNIKISQIKSLNGEIEVAADKSISHRALILGALAHGKTSIKNILRADDVMSTMQCLKDLGVEIKDNENEIIVNGRDSFFTPNKILDVGNSGTSIRLLLGVLASHDINCLISGDSSIQKRPMGRVMIPLTKMGAKFKSNGKEISLEDLTGANDIFFPPIEIKGGQLKGIKYIMPVASAQIKSAILLAGLNAEGETTVIEPGFSRDHTEKMLEYFGAKLNIDGNKISLNGSNRLIGNEIVVPGDISSAAFFMVAAALLKGSELTIKNVGLNSKRTGIIEVMKKMGANIEIQNKKIFANEEKGDILIKHSKLNGIKIEGDIIPKLIDEIPIIALLASLASGTTEISNAKELRVKESDRLKGISEGLAKFGAKIEEKEDGLIIYGQEQLKSAKVSSKKDHRMAMTFIIAGLLSSGETEVDDIECINTSFPNFLDLLKSISINK